MKKLIALAVALVLLLASAAVCEEAEAGILRFSGLSLTHVADGRARTVNFEGITLSFALGGANGVPTLQATFDNGAGQVVDGVMQIVGQEMLFSMGGISGTFFMDMQAFASDGGNGELVAQALGGALLMAGSNLEMVLHALTSEDADGVRKADVPLPTDMLISTAEGMLSVVDGIEATEELDMDELRERVERVDGDALLSFRYDESSRAFTLAAIEGESAIRLSGVMEMSLEPMTFAAISAEEEKYDLLNMEPAVLEQLRGELNLIGIKFMHFADGSGLNDIMD